MFGRRLRRHVNFRSSVAWCFIWNESEEARNKPGFYLSKLYRTEELYSRE